MAGYVSTGQLRDTAISLKCMVRRRTARGLKIGEETVRVNVSGLLVENYSLRARDDDPHVSVLLNPSVPRDTFK